MKRLLLLILLLPCLVYGQTVGIKVAAPIIKNSPSDNTVTGYANLLNGGYHTVGTKNSRDSLVTSFNKTLNKGMLVYVNDVDSTYRWNGTDWTPVLSGGITPEILSDSLSNYTPLQDGLISGGNATIGTGSVTIDTAYYRINKENKISLPRTFSGISNSATGTQYYVLIYGKNDNTLDTLHGVQDTIAIIPTKPNGTVSINTVLVGDGGVETATPDLSGYATLGSNSFIGEQNITGNVNILGEQLNFLGGTSQIVNRNGESLRLYGDDLTLNLSLKTDGTNIFYGNVFAPNLSGTNTGDQTWSTLSGKPDFSTVAISGDYNDLTNKPSQIDTTSLSNRINLKAPLASPSFTGLINNYGNQLNFYGSNSEIVNRSASSLDFYGSGSSLSMSILANGNVGIGTTDPQGYKLFVNGNATASSFVKSGGTSSQFLKADGSSDSNTYLTSSTGVSSITGTTNQVTASASTGAVTLSLPQSIATSSTPQFGGLGLGLASSSSTFLVLGAGTTSKSSLRFGVGSAPTSPVNGDIWYKSDSTLTMYRYSSSDQFMFSNNNKFLKDGQTGALIADGSGNISKAPLGNATAGVLSSRTSSYTILTTDFGGNGKVFVPVDCTSGAVTITLPNLANMQGYEAVIFKTDSSGNAVTVQGDVNINGASTYSLTTQNQSVIIYGFPTLYRAH